MGEGRQRRKGNLDCAPNPSILYNIEKMKGKEKEKEEDFWLGVALDIQ